MSNADGSHAAQARGRSMNLVPAMPTEITDPTLVNCDDAGLFPRSRIPLHSHQVLERYVAANYCDEFGDITALKN